MATTAREVVMEPENRPYVAPDTEPGDAGTEEWADKPPGSSDPVGRGTLADPAGKTDADDVVDGSPADQFINDPDAIDARKDESDGT
jgi:hypothetical protein